eukprot:TRINITY_DN7026_c0_g1_i1.p1 TRINITY_DN7026_c0_g1~~TRINITY_DN7026_c0_g1_i1.p1  ORF type:complete len:622 (+),score=202.30 TRINITY_DN7026_c0_g1_i1:860-2725(+)
MIAEAAGATFLNVLAAGKSSKALKVVAQGACERFEAADRATNADGVKGYILKSFPQYKDHVKYCMSYFKAEAMYHSSQDALAASKYGEEITRLKFALQLADACSKSKYTVDYLTDNVQNLIRKIRTRIPLAEKDNNTIYIDKVPEVKELDEIESRVLGKPSSFEMPAPDTTMFSTLEILKDIPPDTPDVKEDPFESGLKQLRELGYSESDAKKALKANNNDFLASVEFLSNKVQAEEDVKKAKDAKEVKSNEKPSSGGGGGGGLFGIFGSSSFIVDEEMVRQFVELGFTDEQARSALTKSKNDFTKALDSMSQSVEEPPAPAAAPVSAPASKPSPAVASRKADPAPAGPSPADAENQLIAMGFSRDQVRVALAASNNDFSKAFDVLSNVSMEKQPSGDLASAPTEELPDYMSDPPSNAPAAASEPPKHEPKKASGGGGGGFFGLFGKKSDKKPEEKKLEVKPADSDTKQQLLALGFDSAKIDQALAANGNDFNRALDQLSAASSPPPAAAPISAPAPTPASGNSNRAKLTQQLVFMGYSEKQAEAALLLSNDNFAAAVTLLAKQAPAGGPSRPSPAPAPAAVEQISPQMRQLMDMGFPKDKVKDALMKTNNNVDEALGLLM